MYIDTVAVYYYQAAISFTCKTYTINACQSEIIASRKKYLSKMSEF